MCAVCSADFACSASFLGDGLHHSYNNENIWTWNGHGGDWIYQGGPDSSAVLHAPYFNQWGPEGDALDDSPVSYHITEVCAMPWLRAIAAPLQELCMQSAPIVSRHCASLLVASCTLSKSLRAVHFVCSGFTDTARCWSCAAGRCQQCRPLALRCWRRLVLSIVPRPAVTPQPSAG